MADLEQWIVIGIAAGGVIALFIARARASLRTRKKLPDPRFEGRPTK
jgi:hypothetical protein